MLIFLLTLFFYNGALYYCYRTNEDFVTNFIFALIFNVSYFYLLPELVEFVEDSVRRQKSLLLFRGVCIASFAAVILAMLMLK